MDMKIAQKLAIDYYGNNKFVLIDYEHKTETVIESLKAHTLYAFESDKYYFTHKAKNELEYQIEAEYQALRAQEASEAFDAATDTEV